MRVVVIGGGFGGMASAARLAKLGHQVTLLEASDDLGGALGSVERDGFVWDAGAHHTLLPAVIRDLFRKSGRPLERELDLQPLEHVREHRFADGSRVRLPGGSRAEQLNAVEALGSGLGRAWVEHVDAFGRDWELLRRDFFERPWNAELASRELTRVLSSRQSLHRRTRAMKDDRLRLMATHAAELEGHDPRSVPAWVGLSSYVEQKFGVWRVPGGQHLLGSAMADRLATRKVHVATGTRALDLVRDGASGPVTGVRTADGSVPADAVVVAIDPGALPALAGLVRRTTATRLPDVVHLGLRDSPDLPDLGPEGHEVVLHGFPSVTVRTGGAAPEGHRAWTVLVHPTGRRRVDPLDLLADRGVDLRAHLTTRVDRSGADLATLWGGSSNGVLWDGPRTVDRRLGARTPVPGVHVAGAHAATGAGLPFTGLSAALVAQVIGKAERG